MRWVFEESAGVGEGRPTRATPLDATPTRAKATMSDPAQFLQPSPDSTREKAPGWPIQRSLASTGKESRPPFRGGPTGPLGLRLVAAGTGPTRSQGYDQQGRPDPGSLHRVLPAR